GEIAGPADGTDGGGDEVVAEGDAAGGEAVDVRRLGDGAAGAAEAVPAEVVGQEEEDVGRAVGGGGGRGDADEDEQGPCDLHRNPPLTDIGCTRGDCRNPNRPGSRSVGGRRRRRRGWGRRESSGGPSSGRSARLVTRRRGRAIGQQRTRSSAGRRGRWSRVG